MCPVNVARTIGASCQSRSRRSSLRLRNIERAGFNAAAQIADATAQHGLVRAEEIAGLETARRDGFFARTVDLSDIRIGLREKF